MLYHHMFTEHTKICGPLQSAKHSLERFTCSYCERIFTRKKFLVEHINFKHFILDPNLNKCEKCTKIFSTSSVLGRHSKICGLSLSAKNLLKHFECYHCKKQFSRSSMLSEHMMIKHLPFDPSLNRCNVCKKTFSESSSLRKHLKICGLSQYAKL